ncbi:MAG: 4Fe-4S binding protein, partial [Lachnospiraceae bacterium]|nr:4Fe-4S binding protein [Lachnospiraceae bacterium]
LNPISLYRLKIDEDKCVKCGACQRACDMDIKVWEKPNSLECIRCGKCKEACNEGAIKSSFIFPKQSK